MRTNTSGVRPTSPTLSDDLDLSALLGTSSAYVGFTGGTCIAYGLYDIVTWDTEAHTPSPEPRPSIWGVLGGWGLIAARAIRTNCVRCAIFMNSDDEKPGRKTGFPVALPSPPRPPSGIRIAEHVCPWLAAAACKPFLGQLNAPRPEGTTGGDGGEVVVVRSGTGGVRWWLHQRHEWNRGHHSPRKRRALPWIA